MDKNFEAAIEQQMLLAKRKVDFESAKKSNLNSKETFHKLIAVVQSLEAKIDVLIELNTSYQEVVSKYAQIADHNFEIKFLKKED